MMGEVGQNVYLVVEELPKRAESIFLGFDLLQEFLLRLGNLCLPFVVGQLLVCEPLTLLVRLLWCMVGVGTNGSMGLGVHGFHALAVDSCLDVSGKLFLIFFRFVFLQHFHVFGDVTAKNVLAMNLGIEVIFGESGESFGGMGDVDAAVTRSLHGTENASAGGGASKADVQTGSESTGFLTVGVLNLEMIPIGFLLSFVDSIQFEFFQDPSGEQKSGTVRGSVVGEPDLDAVFRKFVGVRRLHDFVSLNSGVRYLANNVLVGGANNHAVLGCIVLVLVLHDQAFPGIVIGFALTASPKLNLVTLEVGFALYNLDEHHGV